jgi:hypothetical protein
MHDSQPVPKQEVDTIGHKSELTRLFLPNKDLPILSSLQFGCIDGLWDEPPKIKMIAVDKIVSTFALKNWADVDEFNSEDKIDRFWEIYQSISKNGFDLQRAKDMVCLNGYGGIYDISEGQRRVMTAKLLGIEEIPALVSECYPTTVTLPTETWYKKMQRRKEEGLWSGQMQFELDSDGDYKTGKAFVADCQGVWALTRDMVIVKKVYEQVGATGQALNPL